MDIAVDLPNLYDERLHRDVSPNSFNFAYPLLTAVARIIFATLRYALVQWLLVVNVPQNLAKSVLIRLNLFFLTVGCLFWHLDALIVHTFLYVSRYLLPEIYV